MENGTEVQKIGEALFSVGIGGIPDAPSVNGDSVGKIHCWSLVPAELFKLKRSVDVCPSF